MRKTIHFRRVEWFGFLEDTPALIRAVLVARLAIGDTQFQLGGEHVELRHRRDQNGDICLHFTTYIAGARKGIVPHGAANNGDLGEVVAGQNRDFSEREVAVVLRGENIAYVGNGWVTAPFVEKVLRNFLLLHHSAEITDRFFLTARADEGALEQLLQEGINSLDLSLALPQVEAGQQMAAQPHTLVGSISRSVRDAISARLQADHDENALENFAKANAHLVLSFRKNAPLEQIDSLTSVARDAIEGDEEFKIRTQRNKSYSREQLLVRGEYKQPGPAAVLSYALTWDALSEFLDEQDE